MSKCSRALGRVASAALVFVVAIVSVSRLGAQIAPLPLTMSKRVTPPGDTMCEKIAPTTKPTVQAIIAPYGWMSGVSGDVGVRDLSADVDVRFVDLLKHLRFAAMGTFEVEYGPWLLVSDNMYLSLAVDHTLSRGRLQPNLDFTFKAFIGQAFAGYSMEASPTVVVDVLLGGRLWATSSTLNVSGDLRSRERSNSANWVDALGGLRVRWDPRERWQLSIAGDAGAGGSTSTVEGMATVGYGLSRHWQVWGAYRYLYENYQKNDFSFKGHLDGPVIGASYHW